MGGPKLICDRGGKVLAEEVAALEEEGNFSLKMQALSVETCYLSFFELYEEPL